MSHMEVRLSDMTLEAEKLREADTVTRKELQTARSIANEASTAASELHNLRSQMADESAKCREEITALSSQLTSLKQQMAGASNAQQSKQGELESVQAENVRLLSQIEGLAREKEDLQKRHDEQISSISTLRNEISNAKGNEERHATSMQQLRSGADAVQQENDQLKAQMLRGRSNVDTLRTELDSEKDAHQKAVDARDELQRLTDDVNREKQELAGSLGETRTNETKLSEAQEVNASERKAMQLEMAKVQTSLEAKDRLLQRLTNESINERKAMSEQHSEESEQLKTRIGELETILRATEGTVQHKTRELEAYDKAVPKNPKKFASEGSIADHVRDLTSKQQLSTNMIVQESNIDQSGSDRSHNSQGRRSPSTTEMIGRNEGPIDKPVEKARKKPIRLNKTVAIITKEPQSQSSHTPESDNGRTDRLEGHDEDVYQSGLGGSQRSDDLGVYEQLNEHGVSSVQPVAEDLQESQRTLPYFMATYNDDVKADPGSGHTGSASSGLSAALASDELIDMGPLEQGAARPNPGHSEVEGVSLANFSQDRPKSQANTGSRMLAPATPIRRSTRNRQPSTKPNRGAPSSHTKFERTGYEQTHFSSPDGARRLRSSDKTYGVHGGASEAGASGLPHQALQSNTNGSTMKRKRPDAGLSERGPSKRYRSPSQSGSSQLQSSSQPAQISQGQSQGPNIMPAAPSRRSKGMSPA